MDEPESPWLDPKMESAYKGGPATPKPDTEEPVIEGWERKGDQVIEFKKKKGGRKVTARKFCKCIKSVKKTVKARKGSNKESAAIAICTKTMLQRRGRTLKRVRCRGVQRLETQKKK